MPPASLKEQDYGERLTHPSLRRQSKLDTHVVILPTCQILVHETSLDGVCVTQYAASGVTRECSAKHKNLECHPAAGKHLFCSVGVLGPARKKVSDKRTCKGMLTCKKENVYAQRCWIILY